MNHDLHDEKSNRVNANSLSSKGNCPYLKSINEKGHKFDVTQFDWSQYFPQFSIESSDGKMKCPLDKDSPLSQWFSLKRPLQSSNQDPQHCVSCQESLDPKEIPILFHNKLYHKGCFANETNHELWFKEPKCPFLDVMPKRTKFLLNDQVEGPVDISSTIKGHISVQPAKVQITNYNIFPTLAITIETPLPKNHFINAILLEKSDKYPILSGFKCGDSQVLLPGVKTLYFTGLKLNKIGVLKKTIGDKKKIKDCFFFIEISIGAAIWTTDSFKLVSSFTQLPEELQEQRPFKKGSQISSDSKEEISSTSKQLSVNYLLNPSNCPVLNYSFYEDSTKN